MNLNCNAIIDLIFKYKKEHNSSYLRQFQEVIYLYVKNWPKKLYSCNEDICHEFVLFILEYTEQIVDSYNLESQVSFFSWFNAVLYNKFCDFSKQGDVSPEKKFLQEERIDPGVSFFSALELTDTDLSEQDAYELLDMLTDMEKSIWVFYNIPQQVTGDMLVNISKYTEIDLQKLLIYHQDILKKQEEIYRNKELCYQKIKYIDHKIMHIKNIISKGINAKKEEELSDKMLRYKNRQHKYIINLKKITHKTANDLANIFNNYDVAYRMLKRINHKLKKYAFEKYNIG